MADIRIPLTIDERRALKQRATAIDSSIRKVVQKLIRAYLESPVSTTPQQEEKQL